MIHDIYSVGTKDMLNVEVNSRNLQGSTPLYLASVGHLEGYPDVVRLLLDHGADTQLVGLTKREKPQRLESR